MNNYFRKSHEIMEKPQRTEERFCQWWQVCIYYASCLCSYRLNAPSVQNTNCWKLLFNKFSGQGTESRNVFVKTSIKSKDWKIYILIWVIYSKKIIKIESFFDWLISFNWLGDNRNFPPEIERFSIFKEIRIFLIFRT